MIYPGQGHTLNGDAAADALRRTAAFLDRHLRARPGGVQNPNQTVVP